MNNIEKEEFASLVAKKVYELIKNDIVELHNPYSPPRKIYNDGVCLHCGGYHGGLGCPKLIAKS